MLCRRCLLLVLSLLPSLLNGQPVNMDSLSRVAHNPAAHDTTRLHAIGQMLDNFSETPERFTYNALLGKIAAANINRKDNNKRSQHIYTMYLAAYYHNLGYYYNLGYQHTQNDLGKALAATDTARKLFLAAGMEEEANISLVSKGIIQSRNMNYKDALDCYFEALGYFERHKEQNPDGISYICSNIAAIYENQKDHHTSISYLHRAIRHLDRKIEAPGYTATVEDAIQKCECLLNMGSSHLNLKQADSAIRYFSAAKDIALGLEHNYYTSIALTKLAIADLDKGMPDSALVKLRTAYDISEEDVPKGYAAIYLGQAYTDTRQYDKALRYIVTGLAAIEGSKEDYLRQQGYELLYTIHKATGNYRKSLEFLEKFTSLKDTLASRENTNLLKQQQLKYDYDKKEFDFRLAAEKKSAFKNYLLSGLGAALLIILAVSYIRYRNSRQKQALASFEKQVLKQKLLVSQMNPHFIFNSIDNIQGLIYADRTQEAVSYLGRFSSLTRQILEYSDEQYISLEEETGMLDNYLSIQQLLYDNSFGFKIIVDPQIDTEHLLLPPMLIQPFIENAIRHGVAGRDNGQIKVLFRLEDNHLCLEVSDNGRGLNTSPSNAQHKSMATRITRERLAVIAPGEQILVTNLADGQGNITGTMVHFKIPYFYEK